MSSQGPADTTFVHVNYSEICETLIDDLVDASDLPGFVSVECTSISGLGLFAFETVQSCIRTLDLLATTYLSVLSSSNASTPLPYLKKPASVSKDSSAICTMP